MPEGYTTKVTGEKQAAVQAVKERFSGVNDYVFTNYRGLTVEQITQIRGALREQDADFRVLKNRTARIAFQDLEYPDVSELLTGPTAVALARGESGPVVKKLIDFAKEMPVELKGGLISGSVFSLEQIEAYSRLPTREELLAKLMSAMNGTAQNLVFVLNAIPQKLVRTLQAVKEKKESEG